MPNARRITEAALRESVAGGYRTLKDIGKDFGVTDERIRQLCAKYSIERGKRAFNTYSPSYQAILTPRSRWPREGISALKRRIGLCSTRGCFTPQAPSRVSCAHHLRLLAVYHLRYYYARKAAA